MGNEHTTRHEQIPTVMDDSLSDQEQVTFQAGSHSEAITMRLEDYQRIAQPGVAHFGRLPWSEVCRPAALNLPRPRVSSPRCGAASRWPPSAP